MKKNLIRIISTVVFAALVVLVIGSVYRALSWKDTTGAYFSSFRQLDATEDDLVDVVFVGSSRCYDSAYPAFYWENAGIAAFDMSVSGQDRDSSYHHLKELLKTQDPKVVFVELYGLYFEKSTIIGNIYRNLLSMKTSKNSVELVNEYISQFGDKDDIPDYVAKFPIVHTRYRELQKYDFVTNVPNTFMRGEHVFWENDPIEGYGAFDYAYDPIELPENRLEWLEKMYELSRKEGFELVFYVAPYAVSESEQTYYDAAAEFAASHGVKMIDFNRLGDVYFDPATDFSDTAHCNAFGAKKVADYLTGFLKENYELEDHRGDARYYQWDKDLEYVYRQKEYNEMNNGELSFTEVLDKLSRMDDVTAIISLEGAYGYNYQESSWGEDFYSLGVSSDDYQIGGKWIYRNGAVTKVNNNDVNEEPYYEELGKYDTLRIKFESHFLSPENIMIGKTGYENGYCSLMVIVYDHTLNEVTVVRRF